MNETLSHTVDEDFIVGFNGLELTCTLLILFSIKTFSFLSDLFNDKEENCISGKFPLSTGLSNVSVGSLQPYFNDSSNHIAFRPL